MATMTPARTGFGFLGFAAIMVAALLIVSMILGTLATSVTMTESTDVAPADMGDEELEVALADAEAALQEAIQRAHDNASVGTDIAAKSSMGKVRARNRVYENLAAEMAKRVSHIVVDIPDEGIMPVAVTHIRERHGMEALDALMTGGWKKGDCNGGKKGYAYKPADDGRWWVRVSWQGKVVTCYRCTWELLCWYFKVDGCKPPRPPFTHDAMSSPAY